MSHSMNHMKQKAAARAEALDHLYNSNVMINRDGRDHEDHKNMQTEAEEKMEHGHKLERGF